MEKKDSIKKVNSRNKNKNKNRNYQIKTREKTLARREMKKNIKLEEDELEVQAIIVNTPTRDNVVIVPDRKIVVSDEDEDPNFISIDIDKFRFSEDQEDLIDKFKFVESENEEAEQSRGELEEVEDYNNYDEDVEVVTSEEDFVVETKEDDERLIPSITDKVDINAKTHINFESRIILLLAFIIISFFVAGIFIFKSVTTLSVNELSYDEEASVDYKVCINDTQSLYYSKNCLDEDMQYLSNITENISVTFDYDVEFNSSVSTTISYYVVSNVNIYKEQYGKVLNTSEEVLVERTASEVFGNELDFSIDALVPYAKYKEYVDNYNKKYNLDSYAEVETILYVDNGNVIKKVAEVRAPLTLQTYSIDVLEVVNEDQNLSLQHTGWDGINAPYGIVGLIFVLFGIFGIMRLSRLVFKVMNTASLYQRKLNKILREYDKYIVISRSGYDVDESKRLIKVDSFGELLDARNTLEKPIVYVKVNSVKSEFYVEDSESIYKYTLKEADCEGK